MRLKTSNILLMLASWLKAFAMRLRGQTTFVKTLIPGWFIIDCHLINQVSLTRDGFFKHGFEWRTYKLPDSWCEQVRKL